MDQRMSAVLWNYGRALLFVFVTIILGWRFGVALRSVWIPSPFTVQLLQVIASGIVLTATLGLGGWAIQSWGGDAFAERVNRWIYVALYIFGTGLFVVITAASASQ